MEDRDYVRLLAKIASNIKKYRQKADYTQEDMVDFGFNYRFFQKIESGRHSFNLYTLHRLSKVFKIRVQDLLR